MPPPPLPRPLTGHRHLHRQLAPRRRPGRGRRGRRRRRLWHARLRRRGCPRGQQARGVHLQLQRGRDRLCAELFSRRLRCDQQRRQRHHGVCCRRHRLRGPQRPALCGARGLGLGRHQQAGLLQRQRLAHLGPQNPHARAGEQPVPEVRPQLHRRQRRGARDRRAGRAAGGIQRDGHRAVRPLQRDRAAQRRRHPQLGLGEFGPRRWGQLIG
jgi:hypothetical protein